MTRTFSSIMWKGIHTEGCSITCDQNWLLAVWVSDLKRNITLSVNRGWDVAGFTGPITRGRSQATESERLFFFPARKIWTIRCSISQPARIETLCALNYETCEKIIKIGAIPLARGVPKLPGATLLWDKSPDKYLYSGEGLLVNLCHSPKMDPIYLGASKLKRM